MFTLFDEWYLSPPALASCHGMNIHPSYGCVYIYIIIYIYYLILLIPIPILALTHSNLLWILWYFPINASDARETTLKTFQTCSNGKQSPTTRTKAVRIRPESRECPFDFSAHGAEFILQSCVLGNHFSPIDQMTAATFYMCKAGWEAGRSLKCFTDLHGTVNSEHIHTNGQSMLRVLLLKFNRKKIEPSLYNLHSRYILEKQLLKFEANFACDDKRTGTGPKLPDTDAGIWTWQEQPDSQAVQQFSISKRAPGSGYDSRIWRNREREIANWLILSHQLSHEISPRHFTTKITCHAPSTILPQIRSQPQCPWTSPGKRMGPWKHTVDTTNAQV